MRGSVADRSRVRLPKLHRPGGVPALHPPGLQVPGQPVHIQDQMMRRPAKTPRFAGRYWGRVRVSGDRSARDEPPLNLGVAERTPLAADGTTFFHERSPFGNAFAARPLRTAMRRRPGRAARGGLTPTTVSSREDWSISTAPRLRPRTVRHAEGGVRCWLGHRPGRAVPPGGPGSRRGRGVRGLPGGTHTPTAVTTSLNRIVGLDPDPPRCGWSSTRRCRVLPEVPDARYWKAP